MKLIQIFVLAITLITAPIATAEPQNKRFSVVAGTPVRISTQHIRLHSIIIQMRTGGTGRGFVLRVAPGIALDASSGTQVSAELAPATATAPGGTYSDNDLAPQGARKEIWLDWLAIAVSADSDMIVSFDPYQ